MALSITCLFSARIRPIHIVFLQSKGFKRWLAPTLRYMKSKQKHQPPVHRSALIEWNYKAELFAFSKRLGEDFDHSLLQQAFTTREYIISEKEKQKAVGIEQPEIDLIDNKQMIESGDRIISNFVLRYLRTVLPKLPEEGILALKQHLLSQEQLAVLASNLGMNDLVLTTETPPEQLTLANTFKAVVASLAESSGIDQANLFVRDFVVTQLVGKNVNDLWKVSNPIELLSDILKRNGQHPAEYRLIGEAGRNTILAAYQVGVYFNKQFAGIGLGESVSVAKEMAAQDVLQKLFDTTDVMKPICFNLKLSSDSTEPISNISIQNWCEKNIEKLICKS